jgi:HEAT repeat protein
MLGHFSAGVLAEDTGAARAVEIERMVSEIKKERPPTGASWVMRIALAKRLFDDIRSLTRTELGNLVPHVVDSVASLLGNEDQTVRSYAADALRQMGPLASRAVPALNEALKEVELRPGTDIVRTGPYSGPAIRRALESITGEDMTPDPYRERAGSWESRNWQADADAR